MTEFVLMFVGIASVVVMLLEHRMLLAAICAGVSLCFGAVLVFNSFFGLDLHPRLKYNLYALLFIVLIIALCVSVKNTVMKVFIGVLFVWMICLYWYYLVPDYSDVTVEKTGYVCEYSRIDEKDGLEVRFHKKVGKIFIEVDYDYTELYENESEWEDTVARKVPVGVRRRTVRY